MPNLNQRQENELEHLQTTFTEVRKGLDSLEKNLAGQFAAAQTSCLRPSVVDASDYARRARVLADQLVRSAERVERALGH